MNSVSQQDLNMLMQNAMSKVNPKLLQALERLTSSPILSTFQSIVSSTPAHPYEQLKKQYLEEGHVPLNINDIEPPENFDLNKITKNLNDIQKRLTSTSNFKLSCLQNFDFNNPVIETKNIENHFSFLSGDSFCVDKTKAKSFISFIETIRTIPQNEIKENPITVAQKLLSHYVNNVGPNL